MISESRPSISVAGTHGKTTTSAMLTWLLKSCGLDVSAFLGGIPGNFGSNFIRGTSDLVVMEADEYDRSFWKLFPQCAVITSMDPDHLDIYGDHDEMVRSYKVFLGQVRKGGCLIYHHRLSSVLGDVFLESQDERNIDHLTYGLEAGDARSKILGVQDGAVVFDFSVGEKTIEQVRLRMPGAHNVLNMTAAMAAAVKLGCAPEELKGPVAAFEGIERRFEVHDLGQGRYLVNDYAHHPKELEAAIRAAREFFPGRKITAVFQPHLYTRTRDFGEGFAAALDTVDRPVLVELYPAREEPIEGIDSAYILGKMHNGHKRETRKEKLIDLLKEEEIEILMILGAGDLDVLVPEIKNTLHCKDDE